MPNSDFVQVALDGTGKRIDTAVQTSDAAGAPIVERQGVFLGDPTTFANKAKVDASGNLATAVPDGADVTQGATSDASSANTVVGLLKAVKALLTGTLTTSVSNFPGTQPVSGSVSVDNLPGTQPISGVVSVSNLPATQPVSGTVTTNDGGTPLTGESLPTGSGIIGWLSRLYVALTGTLTTNATIQGTPTVSVGNFPGTQPISGTVTSNAGSGTLATSVADGSDTALGTTTDLSSANTVVGILKAIKAAITGTLTTNATIVGTPTVTANVGTGTQPVSGTVAVSGSVATTLSGTPAVSVSNFPATQPVSGTVTANAGTGTFASSVADGSNVAIGTTTDASSASTLVGLLKNIKAALAGTLTISGAVTNSNLDVALSTRLKPADTLTAVTTVGAVTAITNALPAGSNSIGAVTNTNLDVALSTRLKPADTLAGITTVAAVTAITNPLPAGTNAIGVVGQKSQITATTTMQSAANANGNGTVVTTDGYNGALLIFISNSTGTATVTIEGSLDSAFTTAQDVIPLGLYKLADNTATNTSRAVVSGAIAVAASTSYLYAVADSFPYIRARISGQASLAALTVKIYQVPS